MRLCAALVPPGTNMVGPISEYVHEWANVADMDVSIKEHALATWHALKKSTKAGPRKSVPSVQELLALMSGKKLPIVVFFLDDTFEEVNYDASTTVGDVVEVSVTVTEVA